MAICCDDSPAYAAETVANPENTASDHEQNIGILTLPIELRPDIYGLLFHDTSNRETYFHSDIVNGRTRCAIEAREIGDKDTLCYLLTSVNLTYTCRGLRRNTLTYFYTTYAPIFNLRRIGNFEKAVRWLSCIEPQYIALLRMLRIFIYISQDGSAGTGAVLTMSILSRERLYGLGDAIVTHGTATLYVTKPGCRKSSTW